MNAKVKQVLDKILASFESGDVPEALSVAVLPQLDVPCSQWSLCNRLICFFAGTSDARGFRQWKAVGRYPKKGSKAIFILSPKYKKVKEEEKEEEKTILTGFVAVPVFAVENTDGEPLEISELKPKELPPLYEVAKEWGLSVNWQSFQGDAYGYFNPDGKEIVLATHDEQVFFHELAHAAHQRVHGNLKPGQLWNQEVAAELTAAVLAHLYGKRTNDGASYRYIRSYAAKASKDVYKACLSVISDVGKCVEKVIQTREGNFHALPYQVAAVHGEGGNNEHSKDE